MKGSRYCGLVALILILHVQPAEAQCTYSVTPTTFSVGSSATSLAIGVTTGTACSWTATSAASWITVTGGATGSGIGTVSISVAANPSAGSRTGTLTVAGQTVTVSQAAGSTQPPAAPKGLRIVP